MLDVSDEFKALRIAGAVVLSKVEYQLVDSDTWTDLLVTGDRELEDGSVDLTEQSWVRRTANITLGGRDALFTSWTHPCSPLNRFRLYTGVRLSRGQVEWCRLGTYVVTSYGRKRSTGRLTLYLADFMHALDSDQLPLPVETAEGELILPYIRRLINATDAQYPGFVDALVTPAFPAAQLIVKPGVDVARVMPEAPVFTDGSRGDAIDYLARLLEATVYADVNGDFVITPSLVTETAPVPVFEFKAGDGGTYSEIDAGGGFEDFANAVSIRNGDYVVESVITSGPLRLRPGFTHRYVEDVSTQSWDEAATDLYAKRVIAERLGLAETVSATALPLPWLEPGDPVSVRDADGFVTQHYLSNINGLPLGAVGTCSIDTRTLRLTSSVVSGIRSQVPFTPRSTDPAVLSVTVDDETSTIAPSSADDVAVLVCRASTVPTGGWDTWVKVYDGGLGLGGDGDDALGVWVGTGLGTGDVAVTGGTVANFLGVVVLGNVRADLVLVDSEQYESDAGAAQLAAPLGTTQVGDIVVSAAIGAGGYYPGDPLEVGVTGFAPVVDVLTDGTPSYGLLVAAGIAQGESAGAEHPMGNDGTGQAINVILRSVAA